MGWVEMASDHAVVFRVDMPDQNMEALVEVEGEVHAMTAGPWGAKEATVEVPGDGMIAYRFGTPAGTLGIAWETVPPSCGTGGIRTAMVNGMTDHYLAFDAAPGLREGEWARMHAAAGGTGRELVQPLRMRGVRVIDTVPTAHGGNVCVCAPACVFY